MIVKQSTQALENSQLALTITVDSKSIEEAYQKRLNKYQKELQIPGFRKGKAPLSVLENKFGTSIREESTFGVLEDALEEAYKSLERKEMPLAYSKPELQNEEELLPFKKGEDLTFRVRYDVLPAVEVSNYTGRDIEIEDAEVTDEDVDKEIEKLREQNAIVRTKDGAVKKGDIVNVDYAEVNEDESINEDTKREGFTFTVGSGLNYYEIDKDVVGMKKGDEKIFDKKYTKSSKNHAGKTLKLYVKVNEVKFRDIPELDDDFAQDVKEEYKTVAELKDATRRKLEEELNEALKNIKFDSLMKKLLEETSISVPHSMVNAELDYSWRGFVQRSQLDEKTLAKFMQMQGQTREDILEQWRPSTVDNLKAQLILDAIKDKQDFKVDEEEFNKRCEKELKNVAEENKDSYKEMIKDDMQYSMVVPFLLEKNNFISGEKKNYHEFFENYYKN